MLVAADEENYFSFCQVSLSLFQMFSIVRTLNSTSPRIHVTARNISSVKITEFIVSNAVRVSIGTMFSINVIIQLEHSVMRRRIRKWKVDILLLILLLKSLSKSLQKNQLKSL